MYFVCIVCQVACIQFVCIVGQVACMQFVCIYCQVACIKFVCVVCQVACMQFVNIAVHSVQNVNFRVYLQYEFTLLGLDNYLHVSRCRLMHIISAHDPCYYSKMTSAGVQDSSGH